jgi:hypothetical protein
MLESSTLLFVVIGLAAGILSGVFGIGGGVVIVPGGADVDVLMAVVTPTLRRIRSAEGGREGWRSFGALPSEPWPRDRE